MWLVAAGIVGDRSMADDVVQEAVVVALRRLGQFEPGTNLKAWTARIVRNVALNAQRNETRRQTAMASASDLFESSKTVRPDRLTGPSDSKNVADHGFDDRVTVALEGMEDVARACLLLRTIGELQYPEIADLLEIPEGTAMSHVHRARRELRGRLAGVWAEHSARTAEGNTG